MNKNQYNWYINAYYGMSSWSKPSTVTTIGVPLIEIDTCKLFLWNGTKWNEV